MSLDKYDNTIKLAIGVAYNGTSYAGWQKQNKVDSIQSRLERAISIVADEPIIVFCAGRTDAGVHSTGQVLHFETRSIRNISAWTLGVNANLPKDISVHWAMQVKKNFHARFSATARRYHYIIYNHKFRPAINFNNVTHYYNFLDADKMSRAAQSLIGENDFTSFRALRCQSSTPWRNIYHIQIRRNGHYILVDIKANSFVYHMVRNIIGALIQIGCGNKPESWMSEILHAKNRKLASNTARAEGLYLVQIDYPLLFNIPSKKINSMFLVN